MKRREYILALIAGAIVLVAVAQRLVLRPLRGAWAGLSARVSARRTALVSAQELIKRAEALEARYRSSAAAAEGDPDTRQIAFLASLQSAAGRAGVRVASEKPALVWKTPARGSGQAARYGECTVSLTFTSSLEALVRFLTELTAGPEVVRVRSLVVTADDSQGRSLKVTLGLSTLVLPADVRRIASGAAKAEANVPAAPGFSGSGRLGGPAGGPSTALAQEVTSTVELAGRGEAQP